ncbi:MAG: hypothetical protein ABJQ29_02250 [Luteolibacter sp.]
MPNEPVRLPVRLPGGLSVSGKLALSCGDSSYDVDFNHGTITLDADSFGSLLNLKKEAENLLSQIKPARPNPAAVVASAPTPLPGGEIHITVKKRPVGKLVDTNGKITFRPTPLQFLKKLF